MLAVMSNSNKLLMKRWFEEVWNQQDATAINRMLHPQAKVYGLTESGDPLVGPDSFKPFHSTFCGAFPDLRIEIDNIVAEDRIVAARWTAAMTHLGAHLGFPATGRKVVLTGMTFAVVDEGQIVEGWNETDLQTLVLKLKTA
jgi:steroid delta-isomerase-like uncharacterized protein